MRLSIFIISLFLATAFSSLTKDLTDIATDLFDSCKPTQIHLALSEAFTPNPTTNSQIRAVFHTTKACESAYIAVSTPTGTQTVQATAVNHFTATYGDIPYSTYVHIFDFPQLEFGQVYNYTCYSDTTSSSTKEGPFEFYIPNPKPTGDVTSVVLFADWSAELEGHDTLDKLTEIKDANFTAISTYIHIGDLCYNLEDLGGLKGNGFMKDIQEFTAEMPYMVTPGNHETKQNFSNFNMRLKMPGYEETQNHYYSYNLGNIHFTSISIDLVEVNPEVLPYMLTWLENDLQQANASRSERPWIVVYTHRPIYCSDVNGTADCNVNAEKYSQLEDILNQYRVDLYMSGHEHAYERMLPIYKSQVAPFEQVDGDTGYHYIINAQAPVYIVQGMAGHTGDGDNKKAFPGKNFTVLVDMEYSITALHALNNTHLYLENIHTNTGEVSDYLYIIKGLESEEGWSWYGLWDSVSGYINSMF